MEDQPTRDRSPETEWRRMARLQYQEEAVRVQHGATAVARRLQQLILEVRAAGAWSEAHSESAQELVALSAAQLDAWLALSPSTEWSAHWRELLALYEEMDEFVDEFANLGKAPAERLRPLLLDFQERFARWQARLTTALNHWRTQVLLLPPE